MTFKNWKIWFKTLPLSLKWFIVLILLRPIVDQFYFLKNISIFLSPLYIIGFLTPFLLGLSFLSARFPKKIKSFVIDTNFGLWGGIVAVNFIFLFFIKPDMAMASAIFKLATPIILYFYCRHFISSKVHLVGLLQAVLYSAIVPAFILFYELTFNPINAEYLTSSRGGGARIQGGYADIMNYAIYVSAALLIKGYFFLRKSRVTKVTLKDWLIIISIATVCFMGLTGIKQTSSWAVATFLVGLFLYFKLSSLKGLLVASFLIPMVIFIGSIAYEEKVKPLVNKEIEVIDGEKGVEKSFNGRMSRWIEYFQIWSEMPTISNFIGVSTSGEEAAFGMTGGIVHNEYMRTLFLSGILGLSLFLAFLFRVFRRAFHMSKPERFLVIGSVGIFALFSVSTTPLNYTPMAYYLIPIFAYAALPKIILKK